MSGRIIGLHEWLETPAGRYLLDWEQARCDQTVADIFGYHALQLGLPELQGLRASRMPHRWLAAHHRPDGAALLTDFAALPFPEASLDLVLLPHTLELSVDPHAALREVGRVLVPEGKAVICGFNPASLWGLRWRRARLYQRLGFGESCPPEVGSLIGCRRLRDWLRLLSFEVESCRFGCYRPAARGEAWLQRLQWMDSLGGRWWPILGAVYFLVAVKRVRGMRLLGPTWRTSRGLAAAPLPAPRRAHPTTRVPNDH